MPNLDLSHRAYFTLSEEDLNHLTFLSTPFKVANVLLPKITLHC